MSSTGEEHAVLVTGWVRQVIPVFDAGGDGARDVLAEVHDALGPMDVAELKSLIVFLTAFLTGVIKAAMPDGRDPEDLALDLHIAAFLKSETQWE